jgi:hypothetical protein
MNKRGTFTFVSLGVFGAESIEIMKETIVNSGSGIVKFDVKFQIIKEEYIVTYSLKIGTVESQQPAVTRKKCVFCAVRAVGCACNNGFPHAISPCGGGLEYLHRSPRES